MSDPEALYARLASGDTGRILAVLEPLAAARAALTGVDLTADLATVPSWSGAAATAFGERVVLSRTAVTTAAERLTDASAVVEAAAAAYGHVRRGADQAIRAYRNGGVTAARAAEVLTGLADAYEEVLRSYAGALRSFRPAFTTVTGGASSAQRPSAAVPPPGTDPRRVAQWWRSLPESVRAELLATRSDEIGRLRGLPAPVLDEANRHRVEADAARYGAERDDLSARIAARAAELGLDPADEGALRSDPALADLLDDRLEANRRLDNATDAAARVAEAAASGYDTYVLSYDVDGPGSKDGLLAIAYGNPDAAANVAVVVPGTLTTLESWYPNGDAAALRAAMDRAEPGANATIAWLGYDAPVWDTTVASPDGAVEGAANLVSDVDGYRAAAGQPQHVSVLGHSYGSVTVGYAAMAGLAADDIAFLGSPGVGASDVDQLSPGAGHVWAGTSEHDPVVQATSGSWFTADGTSVGPYDEEFGANRFAVPDEANLVSAHTLYYSDESLDNLANIATGNYDAVTPGENEDRVDDLVSDAGAGLWSAGEEALRGDWDQAWDELADTGGELLNDAGDVVIGGVGDLVEAGRSVYDNTLGRIF